MAVLVVPDVHERLDRLADALQGRIEKADRVVFLGDHFDAFGPVDLDRIRQICHFINRNIDGLDNTPFVDMDATCGQHTITRRIPADFLLGNHDCHYFFKHNGFQCSGYEPRKQQIIDEMIPEEIRRKFKIYTHVGPYLVSHAGFTEATLQYAKPEVEREALQTAFDGGFDPIFGAGYARGGWQKIGGPTWLDFNVEFEHIDDCPQIVGHTQGREVRYKGPKGQMQSICLDTSCRDIAWIEDNGSVTVERCC